VDAELPEDLFDDDALRAALERGLGWRPVQLQQAPAWAFERVHGGLRRLELGPLGLYGSALPAALTEARQRASSVRWQGAPTLQGGGEGSMTVALEAKRLQGYLLSTRETHLLPVDSTPAARRARFHATKRTQVSRQAPPDTVIAPGSARDLDDAMALYRASLRRWGRTDMPYPRVFFEALLESPVIRLWTLRVQGRLGAAVWLLETRAQSLYWQGVSRLDDGKGERKGEAPLPRHAYPMLRLMDAALGDLAARGIPVLNLGASEGLPQVARFKAELGAVPVAYPALAWDSTAWRVAQSLRRWMGR
jgi:hypothetical protein